MILVYKSHISQLLLPEMDVNGTKFRIINIDEWATITKHKQCRNLNTKLLTDIYIFIYNIMRELFKIKIKNNF